MTYEGWQLAVLKAADDHADGDDTMLDLVARLLTEQDEAKNRLRHLGFGWCGLPWAGVVDEIEEQTQ